MIDDNNLAQSLLVNKEDFRKTMETNARFQELMMMYNTGNPDETGNLK